MIANARGRSIGSTRSATAAWRPAGRCRRPRRRAARSTRSATADGPRPSSPIDAAVASRPPTIVTRRPNRSASQPPSGWETNEPTPKQVTIAPAVVSDRDAAAHQVQRQERLDELAEPVDDGAREEHPERAGQPGRGRPPRPEGRLCVRRTRDGALGRAAPSRKELQVLLGHPARLGARLRQRRSDFRRALPDGAPADHHGRRAR